MNVRITAVEQEAEHDPQQRIREDEERDVLVELRVLDAERLPVEERQPHAPLAGRRRGGEQADQGEQADDDQPAVRVDDAAVAVEALLLDRGGPVRGAQPVGGHDVGAEQGDHDQARGEEQQDPGA